MDLLTASSKKRTMKKVLVLAMICFAFAACNDQPSGEGAGNDTGNDLHNNYPDSAQRDSTMPVGTPDQPHDTTGR
jgi:hypothetical protein